MPGLSDKGADHFTLLLWETRHIFQPTVFRQEFIDWMGGDAEFLAEQISLLQSNEGGLESSKIQKQSQRSAMGACWRSPQRHDNASQSDPSAPAAERSYCHKITIDTTSKSNFIRK